MKKYSLPLPMGKENGAVLITGLIVVAVVTIIVVSIMSGATLEERMASNSRNKQLGLQAAEAVLREAQTPSVFTAAPFEPFNLAGFDASCTNGYCAMPVAGSTPRWQTINWSSTSTTRSLPAGSELQVSKGSGLSDMDIQPRYIVELIGQEGAAVGKMCPPVVVRITARGVSNGSVVFVESYYRYVPLKFDDGSCG